PGAAHARSFDTARTVRPGRRHGAGGGFPRDDRSARGNAGRTRDRGGTRAVGRGHGGGNANGRPPDGGLLAPATEDGPARSARHRWLGDRRLLRRSRDGAPADRRRRPPRPPRAGQPGGPGGAPDPLELTPRRWTPKTPIALATSVPLAATTSPSTVATERL